RKPGLRQSERFLRVGFDLIPAPSGGIGASFVQQGGRKGVVPNAGEGVVNGRVVIKVVGARRAVEGRGIHRDPIDREGDAVVAAKVRIDTPVVLGRRDLVRSGGRVLADVRDA